MGGAAGFIPAVLNVVGGIVGMSEADRARKEAEEAQAKQMEEQNKLMREAEDRQKAQDEQMRSEMASAESARGAKSAKARQRALAQSAMGRTDTILTGPLGVPGEESQAKKTLLGA